MALSGAPTVTRETVEPRQRSGTALGDRFGRRAVLAIGVIGTLCLLPWLGGSIFNDEGASLYSAHLSWSALWAQSQHVDLVFLPYYALLHLWTAISSDAAWARAPSLAAYFVTVVVIGRVGLRVGGTWCGILAALLTASNTLFVEKALNARPYALSTAAVALAGAALVSWLRDRRSSRLWLFCAWAVVATAFQIFSLLAPMAMVLGVLLSRPRDLRRHLRAMLVPVGTLAIVGAAWAVATATQVQQVNWIAISSTGALLANARGPAIGNLFDLALLVIAMAVVILLSARWWNGGRLVMVTLFDSDRDVLALAVAWAVLPTLALVVASFFHPIFWDRYVTASAPGLALAVAIVCAPVIAFVRTWGRGTPGSSRSAGIGLVCLGTILFGLLVGNFWMASSTVTEDLKGVAAYVARHAKPGDELVVYDHSTTAAVEYYLQRDGRSVPLWPQVGLHQPLVEAFDLDLSPRAIAQAPKRLWVVEDTDKSPRFNKMVLHPFYPWGKQLTFNGVTLLLYARTPPAMVVPSRGTTMLLPSRGATVSGRLTLYAGASPGARTVQFQLSGNGYHHLVVAGSVPAVYFYVPAVVGRRGAWDTTNVPNGTYELQSVASYPHGVVIRSAGVRIRVRN